MKKIIYLLLLTTFGIGFIGCEDYMDEINKNTNNPTDMEAKYALPDAMISTAFSVVSGDFAFYSSVYIEHNAGIFNQMYNAEIRVSEPTSSTTYNNTWNTTYANLYNLKGVIMRCSAGGKEEGNFHALGVAQVLTALNLGILTDVMGDVPWSEALQPGEIYQAKLDKQQDIYAQIQTILDDAILNLTKDTDFASLGIQDFLYGGNADQWIKFAYGLKARYTMRLSAKAPNYAKVLEYADKSFASADEQAQIKYNGSSTQSPFYRFYQDRNYFGSSQSLKEKMDNRNDPRRAKFFVKPAASAPTVLFAENGVSEQVQDKYGISGLSIITAPTYLLSYHEIEFLKAEAYYRSGDEANAKAALGKAVTAAFSKVNVGLAGVASDYIAANITTKSGTALLPEIQMQKYLAFFEEEAVEAYNDYRRWKAMGEDNIVLKNTKNFPLRFFYGGSDETTNPNVAAITQNPNYVYTQKVWFAGGE